MSAQAYEITAMLMRYVFVFIGLMIVWRSLRWLRRDARAYRKEMRSLPDAGLVGEMVNMVSGEAQPLPREGVIGSSRDCDIRLRGPGIARSHARFAFEEGKGLKIVPLRRAAVTLGGAPLRAPGYALHGTQLLVGGVPLRVRLFAGLDVPYPCAFAPDEGPWEEREAPMEEAPAPEGFAPAPENRRYDGHFTRDGQMTWQYAYSLDELHDAMEAEQWQRVPPAGQVPDAGVPEPPPLPETRRRRRMRHG